MAEEIIPITPMHYKLLPLTLEESKKAQYWGWNFVSKNRSRYIDADFSNYELQTYDRGYTHVVHNNTVYFIERDFVDLDHNERVFVGRQKNLQTDIVT